MKIAVVNGYSTGRVLVEVLRQRGVPRVHVQALPVMAEYFARDFDAAHYDATLSGAGDPAELAARLSRLGVTQVVAGTESGVLLADTLAHLMGLPGNRYETRTARRDKAVMGRTVAEAGLATPLAGTFEDADAAARWFADRELAEAVVKPPNSAASDNVRFCRSGQEVRRACELVLDSRNIYQERNPAVLVQERLHGVEYYANSVSHAGVHRIAELWRYTKRTGGTGRPVYDYEEPVPLGSAEAAPLREFVPAVLDAIGVSFGAAHTEVMVTARGPVLIESGARLGGGTKPWVVEKYSGVSQTSLLADTLVDPEGLRHFDDTAVAWSSRLRNVALVNPAAGLVRSLDWTARIEALPTLVALAHGVRPGQVLETTTDLVSSPGYVYLAAEDPQDVDRDYRALRAMEADGLYTR
ncbi:ATP-grasp domain-containing protein [Streptomyces sp. NPDC054933]